MFLRHQRIDLRGRHARVAEQLLHDADVGTALQQMGGERVPKRVRAHLLLDPSRGRVLLEDAGAPLAGEPPAAQVQEHRRTRPSRGDLRPNPREVRAHRVTRVPADRDVAFLAPLPEDAHAPLLEVDVVHVEPDELRDPKAAGVERLEDGPVAHALRRRVGMFQHARDVVDRQGPGQRARKLRADDGGRRVLGRLPFPQLEPVEGPDRRQRTHDRRRPVPSPVAMRRGRDRGDVRRHRASVHLPSVRDPALPKERHVPPQIPPVRGHRVRGEPALDREVIQEPLDLLREGVARRHGPSPVQPRPPRTSASGVARSPWASATAGFVTSPR